MTAQIPESLVAAAVSAARKSDQEVADVSLTVIAGEAGISRSTLLRRIGGTRRSLDQAVRATGVDPGGRPPVRERAVDVAAHLIATYGLAALTLDSVAAAAECSVPSLHEAIGNRDALLSAVFERYVPLLDLEPVIAASAGDSEATVREIFRAVINAFEHEPRVLPALLADAFSRPEGPASRVIQQHVPSFMRGLGAWLSEQMSAGRFRDLPLPLAAQLLISPVAVHMLTRPVLAPAFGAGFPTVDQASEIFADNFLRAVSAPPCAR